MVFTSTYNMFWAENLTRRYIAFCPDRPGTWVLTVNDGRGHKVQANVEVADGMKSPDAEIVKANSSKAPGWIEILTGFSVLLNIALIPTALKNRK